MPEVSSHKVCKSCKQSKPFSEFYFYASVEDGRYRSHCKICWRVRCDQYKMTARGHAAAKLASRKYRQTPQGKYSQRRYAQENRLKFPDRVKAGTAIATAVRSGQISKPKVCEICCVEARIEAHHYKGYAWEDRFCVQWLCVWCHKSKHRDLRNPHTQGLVALQEPLPECA